MAGTADRRSRGAIEGESLTVCWIRRLAAGHGLVTLELAGALDTASADATFRSAIPATLRGWMVPGSAGQGRRDE